MADTVGAPPVALAPMAGISDLPFRRLAARFGASWVVSEMVASQDMVAQRPSARAKAELGLGDGRTAVQLAGREPALLAEAARIAVGGGAALIDINMGCPAKRVTSASGTGACGSALMREPDRALALIDAVVAAVPVPVTLKMRLGWDETSLNAPQIAARAVASGVCRITIHGRTRCQFYQGRADWAAIADVVDSVAVPVVANGDIDGVEAAGQALHASGAAGLMVGRAARGRPWLPGALAAHLAGRPIPRAPQGAALAAIVAEHYEEMLGFYGIALGVKVARKHLGWYMDQAGTPAAMRRSLLTAETPSAVLAGLPNAFDATAPAECAA